MKKFGKEPGPQEPTGQRDTLISSGMTVRGEIHVLGGLHVEGRLEGGVEVQGRLVVAPRAEIHGNVKAKEAWVAGTIRGNLKTLESVDLVKGSKLIGDVFARSFRIEDGAFFQGNCFMGETTAEDN